ncbi:MAG: hypothetical protein IPK13_20620 [Deltaproteobacteria bacterium]|nr:hypothetical protein [Deltaproteobacteria bacterium]
MGEFIVDPVVAHEVKWTPEDPHTGEIFIRALTPFQAELLHTVLREALLNHIEGVAVTGVRLEGVSNVFDAVPALEGGLAELVLNLKYIRLDGALCRPGIYPFAARGPGRIESGRLVDALGEGVLNRDLNLCTLHPDGELRMELRVERGSGSALTHSEQPMRDGFLPISAIFVPLRLSIDVVPEEGQDSGGRVSLSVRLRTSGSLSAAEVWSSGLTAAKSLLAASRDALDALSVQVAAGS